MLRSSVIGMWLMAYATMGVDVFFERYSHGFRAPSRLCCGFPQATVVARGNRDVIASDGYNSFVVYAGSDSEFVSKVIP
jgi:hypothetical protein